MRKIYSIWFLLALLAFCGMFPEEDDLFDKSAAERIDEAIKQKICPCCVEQRTDG